LEYHSYNDTKTWYQDLARQYPQIATFVPTVGKTWEDRDIFAFRITANNNQARPKIWIQCNIHARKRLLFPSLSPFLPVGCQLFFLFSFSFFFLAGEWITSATCQYAVNHILSNYGVDGDITALLNQLEFVIIPIVNPDGVSFTWTNDRLWRKNRRNNGASYGVDLNRNYNEQWGGVGSSNSPSSETYRGPSAASEPEVQALNAYFSAQSNVIGMICFCFLKFLGADSDLLGLNRRH